MALKLGKRDPKNAPALLFAKYSTGTMPSFPADDYLSAVDWAGTMNGNDTYGDCVACAVANTINLGTTVLTGLPVKATEDEVLAFYKTQNPGFPSQDDGMDEQTACETLVKTGIQIGGVVYKAAGFAKVDHTNLAEIKAAISIGGSVLFGVQVASAQQDQFPGVWDYVKGSPIEGGHAIIGGGHKDVTSNDVKAACWAAEFGTTDAFLSHQLDECWLIIWPWQLTSKEFVAGMDLATFASDFTAITGAQFPVPVTPSPAPQPVPTPVPVPPAPVPSDVDAAYFATIKPFLNHHHMPSTDAAKLIVAAKEWALAKGYKLSPEHAA